VFTYDEPQHPALPPSGFELDHAHAALVITDPQIDFLSPDGVSWPVFGESIRDNDTVAHIGELLDAAKLSGVTVAVSLVVSLTPWAPYLLYPFKLFTTWVHEGAHALMTVLVDRTGSGVDQPFVEAARVFRGAAAGQDRVFVGNNDFNAAAGRTATVDVSLDGAAGWSSQPAAPTMISGSLTWISAHRGRLR